MNPARGAARWYVAESSAGDAARSVRLGRITAPTRRLALRWLRRQARRFADALDPDPYAPWVPGRALHPVSGGPGLVGGARHPLTGARPDAPAELRAWADSFREHDYALLRLADGLPYEFVARDALAWYGLVVRPLGR
ncbi:hypothetical protein ACTFBT_23760 [Streptomyces microflavus]|uniref:Uncharacterized protein n=1 Tax=Streptomyces microflavus TaxID=1919 RepID=A0A7J0CVH4_STRMI|nr:MULTISPECIES: hypothetical protein [Streptomyces]MDX2975971.1 hypothetical protein [Streptomyces sp. NRRL_B-2249]WSS34716.1 hypothetical protein OG269_15050 [Streptomyces microflavus]WST16718.1 hypothetical protein OG721_23500 [Streptomyces microflavus]GFN06269.1 hypothetical protein Smic_48250 [Streptomyces microflavus]GGX90043.1 hypothetical protein GCM10010298_64550 [Streptomyces microflavus]